MNLVALKTISRATPASSDTDRVRKFAWPGAPILDACAVTMDDWELIALTADGGLHGIHLANGTSRQLAKLALPECHPDSGNDHYGVPALRMHAASDGSHVAIVVDHGHTGIVAETCSGMITMHLDGGDYYEETVPFSACFTRFDDRSVLVHRTAWNRLDASDPQSGKSLTERHIEQHAGGKPPAHYLDYFHGRLSVNSGASRMIDNGWFWHPVSIPLSWSVTDWLRSNPWESEDGASMVALPASDDWNNPFCWIDDKRVAMWAKPEAAVGQATRDDNQPCVQIVDTTTTSRSLDQRWAIDIDQRRVLDMFSDGQRLFLADETGTTAWDLASRNKVATWPGFIACLHDAQRRVLIAVAPDAFAELSLPSGSLPCCS